MEQLFGPCDVEQCKKEGYLCALHDECSYFNIRSGEFCACPCHTSEDVSLRLDKLFGYARGQGIFRRVGH